MDWSKTDIRLLHAGPCAVFQVSPQATVASLKFSFVYRIEYLVKNNREDGVALHYHASKCVGEQAFGMTIYSFEIEIVVNSPYDWYSGFICRTLYVSENVFLWLSLTDSESR